MRGADGDTGQPASVGEEWREVGRVIGLALRREEQPAVPSSRPASVRGLLRPHRARLVEEDIDRRAGRLQLPVARPLRLLDNPGAPRITAPKLSLIHISEPTR